MKKTKKILSILLAVAILITVTVFAIQLYIIELN